MDRPRCRSPSSSFRPPPFVAVADACAAARAAADATEEAASASRFAEKKAGEAVKLAGIAADMAGLAVQATSIPHSPNIADFKYLVSVKNSLRYAIQEMRRQTALLHSVTNLCSSIPDEEGGKVGKVMDHLDHVCKMLQKTSIICEEDLENKNPGWDFDVQEYVDEYDTPSDADDIQHGYISEDEEVWNMVFEDQKYEENKVAVNMGDHCREMGWNFEEWWDRTM